MDHTYSFYIGLSYLQLNEFEKAAQYFKHTIAEQKRRFKEVHHLDLFYYGIVKYEQEKYDEAVNIFDEALSQYPEFSDVIYRSEEHTSELQSRPHLVCRLLLEKKK